MTKVTPTAAYTRAFSAGVDAAEGLVADVLDRMEADAEQYGPAADPIRSFADRVRVDLGLRHPYGPHHDPPGIASRLPA